MLEKGMLSMYGSVTHICPLQSKTRKQIQNSHHLLKFKIPIDSQLRWCRFTGMPGTSIPNWHADTCTKNTCLTDNIDLIVSHIPNAYHQIIFLLIQKVPNFILLHNIDSKINYRFVFFIKLPLGLVNVVNGMVLCWLKIV